MTTWTDTCARARIEGKITKARIVLAAASAVSAHCNNLESCNSYSYIGRFLDSWTTDRTGLSHADYERHLDTHRQNLGLLLTAWRVTATHSGTFTVERRSNEECTAAVKHILEHGVDG